MFYLFLGVLALRTDCHIIFQPPENTIYPICVRVISKCNISGLWKEYDQYLEVACHSYMSLYMDGLNSFYQNIHCLLCNLENSPVNLATLCFDPTHGKGNIMYGFTSLLSFNSDVGDERTLPSCGEFEVSPSDHNCCKL